MKKSDVVGWIGFGVACAIILVIGIFALMTVI